MELLLCLLVASTLPHWTVPQAPTSNGQTAVIELAVGKSRIFSGESVQFKCSVPGHESYNWRYRWFRGTELLQEFEEYTLWEARPEQSGDYHCQGVRDTHRGPLKTVRSLPLFLDVDGGWVILQATPQLMLFGGTATLTCRVRGNRVVKQMILYKDGVELKTATDPKVLVTNLSLQDQGSYWCRATWEERKLSHSALSLATQVSVKEVLTEPVLEILTQNGKWLLLICKVNSHQTAPPINYYFYQDGEQLAPGIDQDRFTVEQSPGQYQCKARVPELDMERWSKPTPYRRGDHSGGSRSAPSMS